jgi:hypothetical protein
MDKPTSPKPQLIREDFLPYDPNPMKNYRIKKVNHNVLGPIYYVEKRTFLFFWENVYLKRSPFIGFYETYEAALQDIKDRVKKENTVEYIYDFE